MKQELLGNLTKITTGKLDVNAGDPNGKYPFFTCAELPYKINEYAFDTEAILVAGNGDLNVKYYHGKFNAYQRTYVIQINKKEDLFCKYLFYFMRGYVDNLRRMSIGGIIKYIKLNYLADAKIPLPPLDDQVRIATVLTRAERLIAKRKESIKALDELLKSIFLEMFGNPGNNEKGWEKATIRDLITEAKYGTSKSADGGSSKYLRMNNITNDGYWDFSNLKYIEIEDSEKSKYTLKKNDIVFNRTNSKELVGKTAVYNRNEEVVIAGYLIRVRTKADINPWYIWGYLNSKAGKLRLFNLCRNIVGMANINAQELQNIPILKPPFELQNQFAAIVEKVESIKAKQTQSLAEMENLYASISQRAFKGELELGRVPVETRPKNKVTITIEEPEIVDTKSREMKFSEEALISILNEQTGKKLSISDIWDLIENSAFEPLSDGNYFEKIPDKEELQAMIIKDLESSNSRLEQVFDVLDSDRNKNAPEKKMVLRVKNDS